MPEESKSHLTYEERCQIYAHLKSGKSLREIGRLINPCHSTISREIARNQGERGYRFQQAQRKSEERRIAISSKPSKITEKTIHPSDQKNDGRHARAWLFLTIPPQKFIHIIELMTVFN